MKLFDFAIHTIHIIAEHINIQFDITRSASYFIKIIMMLSSSIFFW